MTTADELLMAAAESTTDPTEEILVADLNTRVIAIPATLKILGVESDDDTKRLQFKIPRHYGEFDLSTFKFQINFKNARNKGDVYPVKDLTIDDDMISFTWLVDRVAYDYAGEVKFSICMKLYDETGMVIKELNTTFATLPVLEGLETEKAVVDQNPSAFDQVMYRLYAVEAATGNGQNGYYTVIKVAQAETGMLFTIVNQNGESVAYVRHGNDGYTPVKGVDYWTEEDKNEIKQTAVGYAQQTISKWVPKTSPITLYAANWVANKQTISLDGVTSNNLVFVTPESTYDNYLEYASCSVRCTSQANGKLTFECAITPVADLVVHVVHYGDSGFNDIVVTDDGAGNVTIV